MRKLQIQDSEIMRIALQQEIQRSEESRYDHRLHGVLLVSHGLSCHHVAEYLGENPVTIQRWVHRFNERGFGALLDGERPGRPGRITSSQWSELEQALRQSPKRYGYGQNLWEGKLLGHHLRQSYGIDLGVRQCQRIFRQMGFRRRKPRPLIAKADAEAQRRYKKTPPPGLP
jgi:transposase